MDITRPKAYRKTRFVCVSDTHGYTPSQAGFKLPKGDVLIHAGDLTNQGSMSELRRTIDWISKAEFEVKILVAGNHDITLDPEFYSKHGSRFHKQNLEDPTKCIEVITTASPSIVFLSHRSATIQLTRPDGPKTMFTVFGSPYSRFQGSWAFGYEPTDAQSLWDRIPLDTDIVVTHMPPHSLCDNRPEGVALGCEGLRKALRKVRPMLAVCGHVHEGRGYERVRWQISSPPDDQPGIEEGMRGSLPPIGSKKQCLVDLTGKKQRRLDNNDSHACYENQTSRWASTLPLQDESLHLDTATISPAPENKDAGILQDASLTHDRVRGESSEERSGRRETCVVNAAIVAKSWPHNGGMKFHAPIVVDLELPVWSDYLDMGDNSITLSSAKLGKRDSGAQKDMI